jgi:deazaflavin-dependent oxidoreductase (nitroreductase family)
MDRKGKPMLPPRGLAGTAPPIRATGRLNPSRPRSPRQVALTAFGTLHRLLYRASGGRLGRSLRGAPILLLTTTGRRTGQARTWPLCYLAAGEALILVAAAAGAPHDPAWYRNLRADPRVRVQLGGTTRPMVAHIASGAERARLWARLLARFPVCAGYQQRAGRALPVVILRPAPPATTHDSA